MQLFVLVYYRPKSFRGRIEEINYFSLNCHVRFHSDGRALAPSYFLQRGEKANTVVWAVHSSEKTSYVNLTDNSFGLVFAAGIVHRNPVVALLCQEQAAHTQL